MRRTMMTLRRGFHPPRRSDDGRAPPPSTRMHESSSANTCAEDVPTRHEYTTTSPKTTPRKRRRDDANDHVHVEVRHKASSSASDAEHTPQRTPTRVVSYPQNNNNNNVVRSPRQTAADLFRRNHSLAEATTPPRPSNAPPPAPTKGVAPNGVLADLHQQCSSSQPDERTAAGSSPSSSTSNVFVTAMEQMLRESSSLFASQTSMMHVEARTPQKEEDDDHDHDHDHHHHPEKSSAPVPVGLESEKMDVDEADADLDRELAEELRMSMDIGFTPSIGTHIPNYSQRSTTSDAEEEHNTNNVSMAQWMMTEENPMEKQVQGPNINNNNFCGEKHGHQLGQAAQDVPSVAAGGRTRFLFTSAPPPHEPSSPHVMETNTHEAATHTSVSPSRMDDQVEVARPKRTCFAFNGITTHTTSPPTPSYTSCAVGGLQMNEVAPVATSSEPVTEVPPPTTHEEHTNNNNNNSTYNLPPDVFAHYCRVRRVERLYAWQHDVLTRQDLINGHSLVYSLPTSGGKTLVAEVCLLRCVMNVKKSAILVLPFVSLAEEKAAQLRPLGEAFGFGVEAHYGSVGRTPLAASPCIFVCTIEKANSVMNHLLGEEDGRRAREELGLIVVDELHMLGEPKRGATLELLLSKVLLVSDAMKKERKHHLDLVADEESDDKVMPCVQILGMSATIPNLPAIATWLGASSYAADFRPVPLREYAVVKGAVLRDGEVEERRLLASTEAGALMELATEVADGSVLIFCASRQQCVDTARSIARHISTSSTTQRTVPPGLRAMLSDLLSISHFEATQLAELLPHGVAFHHGGLLAEERELVEQAYRAKRVRILCCTSTLAAGVNLPSRRVIFRSPYVGRDFLTRSRYQQMCGRAGRAGYDEYGESFLLLPNHRDEVRGMQLMHQPLERCCSNITEERSGFARALLECVSVGLVRTREDAHEWGRRLLVRHALGPVERSSHASTALIREDEASEGEPDGTITPTTRSNNTEEECAMMILKSYVEESLHTLLGSALLTVVVEPPHEDDEADAQQRATPSSSPRLVSTPFGASAVRSCFTVEEAVMVREELDQLQRGGLILCDDLHLCYYLVPLREVGECDWMLYRTVLSRLSSDRQRIADLIGVDEHYIDQRAMGLGQPQQRAPPASSDSRRRLFIARRFFVALMLADLLAEVPMPVVEQRYNVSRGQLQSLMRSASIFSSSITAFCSAMEWFSLESVLTTFVRRLGFGVKPDVLPLMEIAGMQASRARALWNAGFKKPALIATVDADELVRRVRSANPPDCKSAKFLNRRAAMMIIRESNRLLQSQIQEKKVELQELTVHRMLSS